MSISRRRFLVGTGLVFGSFAIGAYAASGTMASAPPTDADVASQINDWLVIHSTGTVVIRIARTEMGQGSLTGLAQLVAEELDCDWTQIETEYISASRNAASNNVWGSTQTGGSGSIRELQENLRHAGAAAKLMLVAAAADAWQVPSSECHTEKGLIYHVKSGRTTGYGDVAAAAAHMAPPIDVVLKEPKNWRLAGKPLHRLHAEDLLNGTQRYGIDVSLPGMLHASVRACPVRGGRLVQYEESAARAMEGVHTVVRIDDSTVGVIANHWWQAKVAADSLQIEWDVGLNGQKSSASIAEMLEQGLNVKDAFVGFSRGEVDVTEPVSISAEYGFPFQAHAALEPINATVRYTPQRCEAWVSTQDSGACLEAIAEASGLRLDQCDVVLMNPGGGFGRRLYHDYIAHAVALAKAMPGTPIKMIWSREEDMTHDAYHPITRCRLSAVQNTDGDPISLHLRISGQSIRAVHAPQRVGKNGADPHMFHGFNEEAFGYAIPNVRAEYAMRNTHLLPGAWRGVHLNQNMFYLESFIDELAHAAGKDPLAFRRKLLAASPYHLGVLNAVAEAIGWYPGRQNGRALGIAVAAGTESYSAAAAEVSLEDGKLRIHRMVGAIDCGIAVNPGMVKRQIESSFAFGLSACLYGECTVHNGVIEQKNYNSFQVLRMQHMPPVESIVLQSGTFWGGVGEPVVVVAAPAICNAIFAATGKRYRTLPLKNHGII
ncbi:TPA: molybdopterin cofactor-binding domain-containing protein [Serratia marcescens]